MSRKLLSAVVIVTEVFGLVSAGPCDDWGGAAEAIVILGICWAIARAEGF